MANECVKGSMLLGSVVSAKRMRNAGRVSPEQMEARLSREALELVDQKIELVRWYPIGPFNELIDLAWEIDGRRDPAYLEREGAISADRLFDSNRYQQLEFAERNHRPDSRQELLRGARRIVTITGTFYNFLDVSVALEHEGLVIAYRNASVFGDGLVHTSVGFMNQINKRQGSPRRWRGERTRRDEVLFRMPLPKRLAGES